MCRTSIYEARNNFSVLVKTTEEGEVVDDVGFDVRTSRECKDPSKAPWA